MVMCTGNDKKKKKTNMQGTGIHAIAVSTFWFIKPVSGDKGKVKHKDFQER